MLLPRKQQNLNIELQVKIQGKKRKFLMARKKRGTRKTSHSKSKRSVSKSRRKTASRKTSKRAPESKRKAQIAVEYLFIVGIVLAATLFIVAKPVYEKAVVESDIITAQRTVDLVSRISDEVYKLGPGNKKCINVEIPGGVIESKIAYGEVTMSLESRGKITDVVGLHKNNWIAGILPMGKGNYEVCIQQYEGGWGSLYLSGATCSSGDGCKLFCSTVDPDCSDYSNSNGINTFSANYNDLGLEYCGNGILETLEECEVGITCDETNNTGTCSTCECVSYESIPPPFREPPEPPKPPGDGPGFCGNNVKEAGEDCDPPGSTCSNGQTCNNECKCNPPELGCGTGTYGEIGVCGNGKCPKPNDICVNVGPDSCYCTPGPPGQPPGGGPGPGPGGGGSGGPCGGILNADQCSTGACPNPNEICQYSGTGCYCDSFTILATYGDGTFDYDPGAHFEGSNWIYDDLNYEECDPTAGNPTWQCRFSQNDHSTNQYECENSVCQVLGIGSTYIGDFITTGRTDQSDDTLGYDVNADCNTIFDTWTCPSGMSCTIDGKCAADSADKDGLNNNYETQGNYRGLVTAPNNPDSDNDGARDGAEILAGYDPTIPNDYPPTIVLGDGFINDPSNSLEQCDYAAPGNSCSELGPNLECSINSYCTIN